MKNTKRALLHSIIALLLCVAQLLGTTFAWFTDSVTSTQNIIKSGNLDLEMYWTDDLESGVWYDVEDDAHNTIFGYDNWEPGYTEVRYIKIINKGDLAFNYDVTLAPKGAVGKLAEVINVYFMEDVEKNIETREELLGYTSAGPLSVVMNGGKVAHGTLLPAGETDPAHKTESTVLAIGMTMLTTAGNDYQNETVGDFTIKALATQLTYEKDSFGEDYDKDAAPVVVGPSTGSVAVNGTLPTEGVTIDAGNGVSASVPGDVVLESGADKLTLSVYPKDKSDSNITVDSGEHLTALDVHIEGVADTNTKPITVELGKVLHEGLNMGNYTLAHVESGVTNPMTYVAAGDPFTAHNQFKYDPATGNVTIYIATFSEITLVSDDAKKWEGGFDYSWYDDKTSPYTIANADQLAAFGAIVGDMSGRAQDSFAGKTVKLVADINLGDKEADNNPDLIFYPIGYNSDDRKYEKTGVAVTTGFYTFNGTFDGNGHVIANFYQNTWEMKGDNNYYDATLQYYRDGMGLFGKVYGGTVKNLTVERFSSDGEYTTTGVIAAYADGATFENIAIVSCNPRVYNTGNGGIVGCVGWYAKEGNLKTTFKNVTVDNSNKISALWGSYDVACGGLVGQYYPTSGQTSAESPKNAGVHFENCHVSAQIDVYNDVCGNYQYYAYRYAGMMIGSIRENVTVDGHVYPKMDGITANGCTVHFGNWNDYYYCELVDNTTASYTHDYQMSRLVQVDSVDVANKTITVGDKITAIPTSGMANYVVVNGDHATENATCYHFKNGEVYNHEAPGRQPGVDEDGDGQDDLKEDKQHIYLEFNNLFTGYGWGVTSKGVGDLTGVTILDREVANSVEKFASNVEELSNNKEYTLGEIFSFVDNGVELVPGALTVSVANKEENNPVSATIVYDRDNWENGTVTFTGGGDITITIQDYYFCTPTTINVTVTDRQPDEKFDIVMNNGDFLHRVGNSGTVALDKLFKEKDGVTVGTASVTVEAVDGTSASGTYFNNAIQFNGTGVVKVTVTDNDYCIPTELYLEVVDAVNATMATSATSNNVVLLNDIGSGFTVSGRYAVYGNGFTLNYTGNGQYLNNGLRQGLVTVSENGILDNLIINATIYPAAYMYYGYTPLGEYVQNGPSSVEGDRTRYHYQLSGVVAKDNATISNCYIYGARTNIFVDTGDVTIKDTILENGVVANIQIQSTNEYTVTLDNVTTIQHQTNATIVDTSKVMLGAGVLVGPDTTSNPTIVLNGDFKQYNWVTEDDENAVSADTAKLLISGALDNTAYNHTVNGKTASNLGIIYMNTEEAKVEDNTGLPYKEGVVTMSLENGGSVNGKVYSLQNATEDQIHSDYENADRTTVNGDYLPTFEFDLGDQEISYDGSEDTRYLYGDANGITALYQDGEDDLALDLTKLATIYKYDGINYAVTAVCKDANGNALTATNGEVTLSAQGNYTLVFTVEDNIFYDKNGQTVIKTVTREYSVPLSLTVKEADIKNAEVNITKTALDGVYTTVNLTDYELRINFLDCISITDYDNKGTGTTVNLSSDISSATLTPSGVNVFTTASTATITYKDGRVLTVNFSKISGSSPGTKTAKINTSGSVYFTTEGALNNKPTEASSQNKCTITSVSYKGNSGSSVTNDTDVTVTWALGSSSSGGGCVTPDTLVTLADGTQKRIDALNGEEELLVLNHSTGKLEAAPVAYIVDHNGTVSEQEVIRLEFDNGSVVKIIGEHVFFDATLNKYVTLDTNAEKYIGHEFISLATDDSVTETKLVKVESEIVETAVYEVVTYKNLTCFTEGILSASAYMDKLLNVFDINSEYAFDSEDAQKDIETYGLYTYSDFEGLISEEAFDLYDAQYLKIAVGKGYITWDDILELIDIYFNVDVQPIQ